MKMKWQKPSQEIVDLFLSIIPDDKKIQQKKMFGYPCCFYNRNMFMGVHGKNIVIRLEERDRGEFIKKHQAAIFEPMPGRFMKEYCIVPMDLFSDEEQLKLWIGKSLTYAKSLPQKKNA